EGATQYINAIGGQELYKKENFDIHGIQLNFIKPLPIEYKQFNNEFVPWLSIIDVLMFNSKEEIQIMLEQYELI
ncbi:MAG TPA: WbqC family protein, partial [Cytophagaceae bacterium]